jgi:Aromatic acid exporter family member 1
MDRLMRKAARVLMLMAADVLRRVRRRGRSALFRAARMTGATVAAFLIAELVGLRTPPPLIAALTALLVVQTTLASTLATGVERVLSVVAGVTLAVLFVSVVGLTWWSLGALVAASIVVGQVLRLGSNLVEVPISAMLVLGVGYSAGAQAVGAGRVVETLLGAAVGVLVNVLFPPAVQTRYAGQAVETFAEEIAGLLDTAASALSAGAVTEEEAARWLEDARRLNRHAPRVDRALAHAEESRRLNLRALGTPAVGPGLREGLDALEHSSVSMRTLFRAVYDATREQIGVQEDPEYADEVRTSVAFLMREMAGVVRAFGLLLRRELETAGEKEEEQLAGTLEELHKGRLLVEELLLADPRSRHGLWELNSAVLTTVDRMLTELDVATHTRLRMTPVRSTARDRAMLAAERFRRTSRPRARRAAPSAGPGADEPNG